MNKLLYMGACSLFSLSLLTSNSIAADNHSSHHSSSIHNHHKGKWMVGYKFDYQHFTGNKEGSSSVSPSNLFSRYGEVPLDMTMEMYMFEIMYGLTDKLTLMVMPQYMKMGMIHASSHGGGHMHKHEIEGFGDTELSGIYSFYNTKVGNISHNASLNLGLSVPTGKTDVKFTNHHNRILNLPYNMQLGSGTFDPIIGVSYTGASNKWSWGAQTKNYIRIGKNNEGYRQGNKYTGNIWIENQITNIFSASFGLEGEAWENISGRDRTLSLTSIAGAEPDGQAGERLLANIGTNIKTGKNHSLSIKFGIPLYERFDGPLPETDYRLTAGWQITF